MSVNPVCCAVCQATVIEQTVMMTNRYTCPTGMTTFYYGWLMGEPTSSSYKRTIAECVKFKPEKTGSSTNRAGAKFYVTEYRTTDEVCVTVCRCRRAAACGWGG